MKLRISIIGCGQICEAHLREIDHIAGADVVAVCDILHPLAEDVADRFNIRHVFSSYRTMMNETQPDVVHITTPPHTHAEIGFEAIAGGCHIYLEKPFGLNYQQAEEIVQAAKARGVIVCAGFSQLYDLVSARAREYIGSGKLGEVVHIESFYGNSHDGNFSRLFLNDPEHWINKLPGRLFQNIISHPLYHITPYLTEPVEKVQCLAFDRSANSIFFDELRVMLQAGGVTGYLTFTSGVKPITQFVRIYGTRAIAEIDLANHAFRFYSTTQFPGPAARVYNLIRAGKQSAIEGMRHAKQMWSGKDRFFAGMGNLSAAFYDNIRQGNLMPPIDYNEVLKVSSIMDEICRQCRELEVKQREGSFN